MRYFHQISGIALLCTALVASISSVWAEAVPPELVGNWTSSSVSTIDFSDRATGAHAAPSGNVVTHHIRPDGTFLTEIFIQSSMYQCTTTIFITEEGRVESHGSGIAFNVLGGHIRSRDNCRPRWNYEKPNGTKEHVYASWRIQQTQFGPELCFTGLDGKLSCAVRK